MCRWYYCTPEKPYRNNDRLSKTIREISKVVGYKVTYKSQRSLCTLTHTQLEDTLVEKIPYTIAKTNLKCIEINLMRASMQGKILDTPERHRRKLK